MLGFFGTREKTAKDRIDQFITNASQAGKRLPEIAAALRQAGWNDAMVDENIARYVQTDFPLPVPKPEPYSSPRVTLYNVIYFIALFCTVYCTIASLFAFLDYALPDANGNHGGMFYSSRSGVPLTNFSFAEIRRYLATLIVAAPLLVFMHCLIDKVTKQLKQGVPPIRLWFASSTIFIGYIVLFCNAITFVNYFLSGELSMRFLIKILILTATAVALAQYYRLEMREQEGKV